MRGTNPRQVATLICLAVSIGVCGLTVHTLNAQVTKADIVGTVTDQTGAVIPNANVTVTNLGTGEVRSMNSTSTGEYAFTSLQVGAYSVSIVATSFKAFKVPSIALAAGDRARIDARMEPGTASESVTVMGITPALQTDSSSSGDMLGTESVQDLPLSGRNVVNLLQVTAGVNAGQANSLQSGNRNSDQRLTGSYSANGLSDFFNNNMIDGEDNNAAGYIALRPSIEGIDQIKVLTNNYPAELGRAAGAVVNIITKAGSNNFHGSLFEFLRNDSFNARNFFATTGPVPELRWNQFGGSIGGPIIKDKIFFFADVEMLRWIQSYSSILTVPTAYEMDQFLTNGVGDFTDYGAVADPVCQTSSGTIAATCQARYFVQKPHPVSAAYFTMYPHTGQKPGLFANNYLGEPKKTQHATVVDARLDEHFTPKDLMFVRYAYNPTWTFNSSTFPPEKIPGVSQPFSAGLGGANGVSGTSNNNSQNALVEYTHIFKPTLLMELKTGYTRYVQSNVPLGYGMNIPSALGMNNVNLPDVFGTSGMTQFSGGFAPLGSAGYNPGFFTYNVLQVNGALTWIRGSHTIKMGGALMHRETYGFGGTPNAYPTAIAVFFQLPSLALYFPHLAYSPAAMMAGQPLQIVRINQMVKQDMLYWEPSVYFQDDWHATSHLTLNLGLRYEVYPQGSEKHNQISNFNLSTLTLETPATTNSHLGINTEYGNFSPRIGFALQLPHMTALHGGFGVTYYPTISGAGTAVGTGNYPYTFTNTQSLSFATFQFPSLTNFAIPTIGKVSDLAISQTSSISWWPKNVATSYIEQFSLEVQKQFGENVATIGYVGQLGKKFLFTYNADMPLPPGANSTAVPKLIYSTQYPNLNNMAVINNAGTSNYHAVRGMLQRRTANGLTYNMNYTYARNLTDTFSINAFNGNSGIVGGFFANNPRYDYGNSDFDVRSRLAGSITYAIPYGQHFTGAKGLALKGWQANTIAYWQTGLPITVTDNYNFYLNGNTSGTQTTQNLLPYYASFAGIATPTDRPNMVHGAKLSNSSIHQYFDVTAFRAQTSGVVGNEHRNQIYGPHDRRMDLSLFKTFQIREQVAVQFRAECYNIFNIPNFAQPNSNITGWNSADSPIASNQTLVPGALPTAFNSPSTNHFVGVARAASTFGQISATAANEQPRTFQFALKATF